MIGVVLGPPVVTLHALGIAIQPRRTAEADIGLDPDDGMDLAALKRSCISSHATAG